MSKRYYNNTMAAMAVICLLAITIGVYGCGLMGIAKPPSVCDNTTAGESLLCDLAATHDLHLETAGNFLMVLNLRAIKEGAYTQQQALSIVHSMRDLLIANAVLSGQDIYKYVMRYVDAFPELLLAAPYLAYLNVRDIIHPKDRELTIAWLDQQIDLLQ